MSNTKRPNTLSFTLFSTVPAVGKYIINNPDFFENNLTQRDKFSLQFQHALLVSTDRIFYTQSGKQNLYAYRPVCH